MIMNGVPCCQWVMHLLEDIMKFSDSRFEIQQYMPLVKELVRRDLKVKYRRSFLGYLWSLMNPLLMMCVLTAVFSHFFRFDIPNYPLYLIIGQVWFAFFSEATSRAMGSILGNGALLKKVYLPKFVFPMASVFSSLNNMLFSVVAIFIVMLATGISFSISQLLLPVPILFMLIFSMGVAFILSSLAVYFRDMFHLYGVFLTILNYATPIFYPISVVPENIRPLLMLNPLYHYIDYCRQILIQGSVPGIEETALCLIISVVTFGAGLVIFRKMQKKFLLYV